MSNTYGLIDRLIELNLTHGLIEPMDQIYMRNRLLAILGEVDYETTPALSGDLYETLDALTDIALQKNLIDDTGADRDIFTSNLMNLFLDKPSVVNAKFFDKYATSPKLATDYFYHTSRMCNYVKVDRIAKNKEFTTDSPYGPIQVTINLSKPEKDPKEIARMKSAPPNKYPSCLLCVENEGYNGTVTLPDRANHRMIRLTLNNHDWMIQYSPYLYYNEHCIILSTSHTPMKITQDTFHNLLDFTTLFPHYFIGSNADLPIVGGSILSHEHYQGGSYTFPLDHAKALFDFSIPNYSSIRGSVLNWPLSTIELRSTSTEDLAKCSHEVLELWKNFSDAKNDILAFSDDIPHNTITPICKRDGDDYVMRLVLRNNRTSTEHPLGIFHPHADVHHIKKENIGLIEVMGLAILPGRLLTELEEIKAFIVGSTDTVATYHEEWATQLKATYHSALDLDTYVMQAVGDKFTRVLEDAGVYKLTAEGIDGFKNFIKTFGSL
ncbi:MAG: UDP-glucose--hexose-1-phosphate uridylyltransferase [Cellulosilyticaceae bacterium]